MKAVSGREASDFLKFVPMCDITCRKCAVMYPSVLKLGVFLEVSRVSFSCFFKKIFNRMVCTQPA